MGKKNISPLQVIVVPMEAYAVVTAQDAKQHNIRMLASLGYDECVGVLFTAKNNKGKPIGYALSHMFINNSAPATIEAMWRDLQLLEPHRIEAKAFGGSMREQHFFERKLCVETKKKLEELEPDVIRDLVAQEKKYALNVRIDILGDRFSMVKKYPEYVDVADTIPLLAKQLHKAGCQSPLGRALSASHKDDRCVKFDWPVHFEEMRKIYDAIKEAVTPEGLLPNGLHGFKRGDSLYQLYPRGGRGGHGARK